MSTPICHRTLGPFIVTYVDGVRQDQESLGTDCLGSACALWVPEKVEGPKLLEWRLTGRGQCADNPRCKPWPDPAAPAKTGGAS